MKYTFYFVNSSRVISEWSGRFDNREAAERFAEGAVASASLNFGKKIGVYVIPDGDERPISKNMWYKLEDVLFRYIEEKKSQIGKQLKLK